MGNLACVPQAPGRFRYSFSRKASFRKEQESKKKLAGLFGFEPEHQEREVTTDKILQYIPGKNFTTQENEKENFDQRFLSLFKKGRRKTVVRNLGKIIYYSKVKFKFQHSQEVKDCYLELFQAYLYFQSLGPNGHTYQGLLPLRELQLSEHENEKDVQDDLHAFQITGPLLSPLVIYCPSWTELQHWLYHLEKQIQLNGGHQDLALEAQEWKLSSLGRQQLRWSMQNAHVQEWKGTQRKSLGDILCVSKVKLQHLPFQEEHNRLLVLYPSTLVIISEERNGLYFKGELPLNAIQVQFEENQKTAFLIEGRLINSIRVICSSYEDYQEWLYCLKTAQFRHADSSLSGSESISGARPSLLTHFSGSGRGSLTSEGRTNSWASGGKGPVSTHHSQTSTASLSERQSFDAVPENGLAGDPWTQPAHGSGSRGPAGTKMLKPELKRKGSSRKSKGKGGVPVWAPKGSHAESERSHFHLLPEPLRGEALSPVYNEPYTALIQQQHSAIPPLHLDLSNLKQWNMARIPNSITPQNLGNGSLSSSPMYADPYTPSSSSCGAAAGTHFLEEFGRPQTLSASEQQNGYPAMLVTVPVSHHPPGPKSSQVLGGNLWRDRSLAEGGRGPASGCRFARDLPLDADCLTTSTLSRDDLWLRSLPTSEESLGTYDLPERRRERLDSSYHDYAELQSFQDDFSYDNIWDTEVKKPGAPSEEEIYDC